MTRKRGRRIWVFGAAIALMLFPMIADLASGAADAPDAVHATMADSPAEAPADAHVESEDGGHGSQQVLNDFLALFLILLLAKLGGDLMERVKQPSVLGELVFGMILGNLVLFGLPPDSAFAGFIEFIKHDTVLEVIAELGVVILLFQIGLESTLGEMFKVGLSSLLVAILGVVAPFLLGLGVSYWILGPDHDLMVHLFIATVLCATSVGITARVLQDIGKLQTREAKIILGAAVIDDVLGLIVLSVVQGMISAADAGQTLAVTDVAWIVGKAGLFFVGAIAIGVTMSPKLYRLASFLRSYGILLTLSLMICLILSWIAGMIDLAPIVGAFCAGLILEDASFQELGDYKRHDLEELVQPIAAFLVPVFFVRMGLLVELETFGQTSILWFAFMLTIAAIIGKQICSLGVLDKTVNRFVVGLGMIPRGEVGLIVASIGMSLTIGGENVISQEIYSAVVIMVIVTTLVTPPILTWRMRDPAPGSTDESPPAG